MVYTTKTYNKTQMNILLVTKQKLSRYWSFEVGSTENKGIDIYIDIDANQ